MKKKKSSYISNNNNDNKSYHFLPPMVWAVFIVVLTYLYSFILTHTHKPHNKKPTTKPHFVLPSHCRGIAGTDRIHKCPKVACVVRDIGEVFKPGTLGLKPGIIKNLIYRCLKCDFTYFICIHFISHKKMIFNLRLITSLWSLAPQTQHKTTFFCDLSFLMLIQS